MKKISGVLVFVVIFILLFIITKQSQYWDYDLWARLIAGMGVIDGHTVLKSDFLSYTGVSPWIDHEYGSGAIFYLLLKYFGAVSLIVFQVIILFLMFFFMIRTIKLRKISEVYNLIFWLISVFSLSNIINAPIRCQIFSFLFFAVFLYILEKARKCNSKYLYILPLVTLLWNNLHGGVVAGIGLIFLYILGELLNKREVKHFLISGLLSIGMLLINPWGFSYLKFLLSANTMPRTYIAEWFGLFSPNQPFNFLTFKVFLLMIIALEICVLIKFRVKYKSSELFFQNLDKTKYIVLLVTLCLAIAHVKLIPLFVISGCVFCYEDFVSYIEPKIPMFAKYIVAFVAGVMCLIGLYANFNTNIPLGAKYYPHREVEFIKLNNISGNILSNFGYGSFIAYKLYPQNKIYMDGRYEEVYDDNLLILLKNFYLLEDNWDAILVKYPPDIMILEKDYPVYIEIGKLNNWVNVYETEKFGVFVKKENAKNNYAQPTDNPTYYINTLFDTSVNFNL